MPSPLKEALHPYFFDVARWGAEAPVSETAVIAAFLVMASLLPDAMVQPRAGHRLGARSLVGLCLHTLLVLAAFGLLLAASGQLLASAAMVLALGVSLALVSNAKNAALGEPLLFSDLALVASVFRHPQFYLSALRPWQMALLVSAALLLPVLLLWLFVPLLAPHLVGFRLFATASALLLLLLRLPPWTTYAKLPQPRADVQRHGLFATLLLHAWRWRQSLDPPPSEAITSTGGLALIVIVQCESFADPAELFGDPALALPALAAARASAWRWGRLQVSGFGAYTMRTEYGVLFGRSEAELGFRRFDPYLTALAETSYALPARLRPAGWRSLFFHPHDMRFYNRGRIMPAAGFDDLLGPEHFAAPQPGEGHYVTDAAIAERLLAQASAAVGPTLLYAVTIENHGPWAPDTTTGPSVLGPYLRLVHNSDKMLSTLVAGLAGLGRPALLVFFGDHRPSIPGLSLPGGDRHTPFVMLRLDAAGRPLSGDGRPQDVTPADLHHLILAELSPVESQ